MGYTEKDFERFRSNELAKGDTFKFKCQMCGRCCRNRTEPVMVNGFDVFRFSKALDMPLRDSLLLNCKMYIGDSSHIPVFALSERMDGSCRLMRKGKCIVQDNKPIVCALFPLGRYYDVRDNSYHYFRNAGICPGTDAGNERTLSDWLERFHIEELTDETTAWSKLMLGIAGATARWDKHRVESNIELINVMVGLLYTNYQYDSPYIQQVEMNMEMAKVYFQMRFNKKLDF